MRWRLVDAAPLELEPVDTLPGESHYYIGDAAQAWRERVPLVGRVRAPQVYPGIDVVFYGNQRRLEHDFIVSPDADPAQIGFAFDGAQRVELNAAGDLDVLLADGRLTQHAPIAYQEDLGRRIPVDAAYTVSTDGRVRLSVGSYDRTRPLVIDPVLEYSTYFGGADYEDLCAVGVDPLDGTFVIAATTYSLNLPVVGGTGFSGTGGSDAFVARVRGSTLLFSTYLGSTADDWANDLAIDANGAMYLGGFTEGAFPVSTGAYDTTRGGYSDGFVVKLARNGTRAYATYLGGNTDPGDGESGGAEGVSALHVTASGVVTAVGWTNGSDYPTTPSAWDTTPNGGIDGFITRLNAAGSGLLFSTYVGGSGDDYAEAVAVDQAGAAYAAGGTYSTNYPTTGGAFQTTAIAGDYSRGFLTKIASTGATAVYSSYFRRTNVDDTFDDFWIYDIAVDQAGAAYLTGYTTSASMPVTGGAFKTSISGYYEAFVVKFTPLGSGLEYSTYLGDTTQDPYAYAWGRAVAVDAAGRAHVAGYTYGSGFPTTPGSYRTTPYSDGDAGFLVVLNASGTQLVHGTLVGSSQSDSLVSLTLDASGAPYLGGYTDTSTNPAAFPTTPDAYRKTGAGYYDGVAVKFSNTFDAQRRFDSSAEANIPDYPGQGQPVPVVQRLALSGIPGTVESARVSLHITHPRPGDLGMRLIGPDQTAVVLVNPRILTGANYGTSCSPEEVRTTFSDTAKVSIGSAQAVPPFLGGYQPAQALSAFSGKTGAALNGAWTLEVSDTVGGQSGILQCWSLELTMREPAITNVSPVNGPSAGGTSITITGSNFVSPAEVRVGGSLAKVANLSPTTITAFTPSHAPGLVDVAVTNPDGLMGSKSNAFTYIGPQHLTTNLTGTGLGLVTSAPAGISCEEVCDHDFAYGTVVTLTATPSPDSMFLGWSGETCGGSGGQSSLTCPVTMDRARNVTARFSLLEDRVITFTGLESGRFSTYGQFGFTTSPASGSWSVRTTYGAPAPFIYFNGSSSGGAVTAAVTITRGGVPFRFTSVDLYSSTTPIPWRFTGQRDSKAVFSVTGQHGNTFGNFATVLNPRADDEIDTLVIELTNPAWSECCASNPMGLDNIAFRAPVLPAVEGTTSLDIRGGGGELPDNGSYEPSLSFDGRYMAFRSLATNLAGVPAGPNNVSQIYVLDRLTKVITRVSVNANGEAGNGNSAHPKISDDGRWVAFESVADNLVPGDANGFSDVFLHDRDADGDGVFDEAGVTDTRRVSVSTGGVAGNGPSVTPDLSPDGYYVVFASKASNLVPNDTNGLQDIFLHHWPSGETTRVSVGPGGAQLTQSSRNPAVSRNARRIVYVLDKVGASAPAAQSFASAGASSLTATRGLALDTPAADEDKDVVVSFTPEDGNSEQVSSSTGDSDNPEVSGDGGTVAYNQEDASGKEDVWVGDVDAGTPPQQVSNPSAGGSDLGNSSDPVLDDSGCQVAYTSTSNLSPEDADDKEDVYLVSPCTGGTPSESQVVSVDGTGEQSGVPSGNPAISGDGSSFAFEASSDLTEPPGGGTVDVVYAHTSLLLTHVSPASGPGTVATLVTLHGTNFDTGAPTTVTFDGVAATEVVVQNATTITARTPIHPSVGAVNVKVMQSARQATRVNGYTFLYEAGLDLTGDADGDTLPNDWESAAGLDPNSAAGNNGMDGDPDGDGRTNAQELGDGTHPNGIYKYYLAEGANSSFLSTRMALLNAGAATAHVQMRFLRPSAAPLPFWRQLPAASREGVETPFIPGLEDTAFSTVVESDVDVVVDRTMSWPPDNPYGQHAEHAATTTSTVWYLAEGATHFGFDLFYLLQNSTDTDAVVDVRYLRPAPLPPLTKTYTVPKQSRQNIWVDLEEFPGLGRALEATDVSAVITSTNGVQISVERAMYLTASGELFRAGHESAAVREPALEWFLAEGATGPFFDLFVLVANPTSTAAQVTAKYLLPSGQTLTKSYVVAANSRFNIWVDEEVFPGGLGKALADTAVSTIVTSTNGVPIIVERAMWWPGPTAATWVEAHNAPGATTAGTLWAVADGEVRSNPDAETYLLVANTSPFAARIRVTAIFEGGGPPAVREFDVLANSRFNVDMRAHMPETAGRTFSTTVESIGATPAQIVVERAMYVSTRGVVWNGGSDMLGVRLR